MSQTPNELPQRAIELGENTVVKQKAYDVLFKLKAVAYYERMKRIGIKNAVKQTQLAKFPSCPESQQANKRTMIGRWVKNKTKLIEQFRKDPQARRIRPKFIESLLPEELENEILEWYKDLREKGCAVSGKFLARHALSIVDEYNEQLENQESWIDFSASRMWLQRFLKRHSLSFRSKTRVGQQLPQDVELKHQEFLKRVTEAINALEITDNQFIVNADQTPVFFEAIPRRTIDSVGAKTVFIRSTGAEKQRVTGN